MPEYEVSWQAFGVFTVTADNEDEAVEELESELFPIDWDGLDWEVEEV